MVYPRPVRPRLLFVTVPATAKRFRLRRRWPATGGPQPISTTTCTWSPPVESELQYTPPGMTLPSLSWRMLRALDSGGGTATRCWVAVRDLGPCTATQRRVTVPPAALHEGDSRRACETDAQEVGWGARLWATTRRRVRNPGRTGRTTPRRGRSHSVTGGMATRRCVAMSSEARRNMATQRRLAMPPPRLRPYARAWKSVARYRGEPCPKRENQDADLPPALVVAAIRKAPLLQRV